MRVRYSFSSKRTGHLENMEKQRRKYPDIVDEIIKVSDVIIEVLDARFIEDTRNLEIEEAVKMKGKKLIYVLNKCDLVDLEEKKKEMNEKGLYPYVFVSCTTRKGSRELRDRIKMEAKRVVLPHEEMRRVQIGIIGYPNTGKSSLINFLTGGSAAKVGKEAGFTKTMQKIRLTADILILDTPGVIPEREYSTHAQELISKHAKVSARDATKVKRPDMVIQTLMREYGKQIEEYYRIKADGNGDVLIEEYGKQKNMLRRGGVVDEDRAARAILTDWQEGKILI